jgi:hypothetical protein
MVNVTKILQKDIQNDKNYENTLCRSNKGHKMNIPGMVKVLSWRAGLGSLGTREVEWRVWHGGPESISMIKNWNFEKVGAFGSHIYILHNTYT